MFVFCSVCYNLIIRYYPHSVKKVLIKISMLTKKQKEILDYINQYIKKNDYAPTLREIMGHFGLKSVSNIHQHIEALKEKGYLKKEEKQPRAIELQKINKSNLLNIPLAGTITAGEPIEPIEEKGEYITINKEQLSRSGNYYALKVMGDSMIKDGIFDGDIAIIRKQSTANNGQTVVAVIDDGGATLKRIYKEKQRIRLQPANPKLDPIYRKKVEVRGVVEKIIREYG